MTAEDIREHLGNLIGVITFEYNGKNCGIAPLSLNKFVMANVCIEPDTSLKVKIFFNTKVFPAFPRMAAGRYAVLASSPGVSLMLK